MPAAGTGLLRLAVEEVASGCRRRLARLAPSFTALRATGIGRPVPPLLRGRAEVAAEIYRGEFNFAGHAIRAAAGGGSVFSLASAPSEWLAELHGFDWLRHLAAAGRELQRVNARALIADWMAETGRHPRVAGRTDVAARRLIAWTGHASFTLRGASEAFEARLLRQLSREVRALLYRLPGECDARRRLLAAVALAQASVGLAGLEALRAQAFPMLEAELDRQVLADGGHRSRNPAEVVTLMVELVPLRQALEAARLATPERLNAAIERMLPALRFFSHGDGGLSAFHGVTDPLAGPARAVLDTDSVLGKPLSHMVHSGYGRLQAGQAVVIADVGGPPRPGDNPRAGSGPLAFEFSDGAHRVVVNCGATAAADAGWDLAARHTAAHSTVCLGGEPAGRILAGGLTRCIFGGPVVAGPVEVEADVASGRDGGLIVGRHDGYRHRFGVVHERRLFLAAGGRDLRGEDRFLPDLHRLSRVGPSDFAIRFHLHPSVSASLSRDRGSVMVVLPNRAGWRFSARGGLLALEESVCLAGQASPRRSLQIVLSGTVGRPDRVLWAFKRVERRGPPTGRSGEPQLPL
jgi:uncharacterized heparinase superfamily protein